MPEIADIVQVSIKVASGGVSRQGFGNAMLFIPSVWTSGARVIVLKKYTDLNAFLAGKPIPSAVTAFFAQKDHPPVLKVGLGASGESVTTAMAAIEAEDADWYGLLIHARDLTTVEAVGDWAELRPKPVLFLGNTADAAVLGNGASVATYLGDKAYNATMLAYHAPHARVYKLTINAKFVANNTIDLKINGSAITQVVFAGDSDTTLAQLATNIALKAGVASAVVTQVGGAADNDREIVITGTDALQDTLITGYVCAVGVVNSAKVTVVSGGAEDFAAAWMASRLGQNPGSSNWKFGKLVGLTPDVLSPTEQAALAYRNVNTYQPYGSTALPAEGKLVDGSFVDVKQIKDWLQVNMAADVFDLLQLVAPGKVPYTQEGYEQVAGQMRKRLKLGVTAKALAADPAPVVTVPKVADANPQDKAARALKGLSFTAVLTGAVNSVALEGTLDF